MLFDLILCIYYVNVDRIRNVIRSAKHGIGVKKGE